mmetsp:Transcript_24398/g.50656  ORF Transcript_24398/g.50656 Transcript_24398/m.50656 type:complete len:223 (+) Transcript_24398:902-1570(+)
MAVAQPNLSTQMASSQRSCGKSGRKANSFNAVPAPSVRWQPKSCALPEAPPMKSTVSIFSPTRMPNPREKTSTQPQAIRSSKGTSGVARANSERTVAPSYTHCRARKYCNSELVNCRASRYPSSGSPLPCTRPCASAVMFGSTGVKPPSTVQSCVSCSSAASCAMISCRRHSLRGLSCGTWRLSIHATAATITSIIAQPNPIESLFSDETFLHSTQIFLLER